MDLKIFWAVLVSIFLAELGDKTQLVVFCYSSSLRQSLSIFIGAMCGFFLTTSLAILAGNFVSTYIPAQVVKIIAGILFILIGIFMIAKSG